MSAMLVSVCVPTYNGQRYLRDCVDSALSQTHADLEVLIIDDASTDRTLDVAHEAAVSDPRVRLISNQHNLGLVGNWNRCLVEARGQWIKFLFQDDLISPNCVESLLDAAISSGKRFVACFRDFLFDETVDESVAETYRAQARLMASWYDEPQLSAAQFARFAFTAPLRNLVGEPTSVMFRRELVAEAGLFDPSLIHLCDAEYWLRLASKDGIAMVRRALATFRVHGASTTSKNTSSRAYRTQSLDPMLIAYNMLYSPLHAVLRAQLDDPRLLRAKAHKFWSMRHYAWQHARRCEKLGIPGPMREWAAICALYPALRNAPLDEHARIRLCALARRLRLSGGG